MARKRIKVDPSGYSILVVDDQDETLISCKLLLEREGHRVLTAVDGREALSLISDEQFDLIVVDYFMPQMNCEELVRAIRNIDSDVQIILQTGYSGEKPPRQMLQLLDIQGYHDKSEGPDRLLLWVDVALKTAAQLRRIQQHERELIESRGELRRLSARLLEVQQAEGERIGRELHDQVGQLLTAIGLDIDWALSHSPRDLDGPRERLTEAANLVQQAIAETGELCATLRPGTLTGLRVIEEIKCHAREFAERAGLSLCVTGDCSELNLPEGVGHHTYRIAQEALSNIGRHATASAVKLEVGLSAGRFLMSIEDNGKGFELTKLSDPHAVGLIGMRERAHLIGAKLDIHSTPGLGTTVRLEIPIVDRS
jgi:signal transduction histidine kinase